MLDVKCLLQGSDLRQFWSWLGHLWEVGFSGSWVASSWGVGKNKV